MSCRSTFLWKYFIHSIVKTSYIHNIVEQSQSHLLRIGTKQYLLIWLEKVSYISSYLLLPRKKNHAYPTDSQYSTWLLKTYSRLHHLSHSRHFVNAWLILLVNIQGRIQNDYVSSVGFNVKKCRPPWLADG